MMNLEIKHITRNDYPMAIDLVYKVFIEFEGNDYSPQGIEEFNKSIHDLNFLGMLNMYGAFDNGNLVGVFAARSNNTHVALFFVEKVYQNQGVGKTLFDYFIKENQPFFLTVNSSPYAVEVYKHLGFHQTKEEQDINGIRFIPMKKFIY